MTKKKLLTLGLVIFILGIIAAFFTYDYMYKSHRNIAEEEAIVIISAEELKKNFSNSNGTSKFSDKVVELNGVVSAIEQKTTIVIEDKVQVDFDSEKQVEKRFVEGSSITIKGRCVGYDDLLEIVKIDQAVLINK